MKLRKILALMLIMILSITNIGNIKTVKAEEVKKAYINIGVGTGDYLDYDIDFSAYKAVKISKVYAYISSEKKIDITSGVTQQIKEGNYITRIKGRLTKENYNVDKKNIILPDMLSPSDANRSDFDIPDKVEYVKYNDWDSINIEYFSPGLSKYPSYRGLIEYHFPRNENRLTWLRDPDTGQWRWMTNNDYVADVNNGIDQGGKNTTKSIQSSGKTYEVNGYKVNASSLQPVNNSNYIYNYITAKYRYPVQDASFEDSSTWTKHPPFETGELPNPYTIVGKFIPLYNYGFVVHLQGIGEKQNDNMLEIEYEGETEGDDPPPPPEPSNTPPIAYINAPDAVALGEEAFIKGNGYDEEDGDNLTYSWTISPAPYSQTNISDKEIIAVFNTIRSYTVKLTVTDSGGLSDTAQASIRVITPIPTAKIKTTGTLKVNRKVVLDASSSYSGSPMATIDWSKTKWVITPVTAGISSSDIKTLDSYTGTKAMNMLFKKAGTYKVQCTVYNNYNMQSTVEIDINIADDEPPIADFNITKTVLRNPEDDNLGTIVVTDNSVSPDNDVIGKRIWMYAFDSNNDGNFDNEKWYVWDNMTWKLAANSYQDLKKIDVNSIVDNNMTSAIVKSNHVGKYKFELIVVEDFLGETIPEFITEDDIKRSDTFDH